MFSFNPSINFDNCETMKECFLKFDKNNKGYLDENDFLNLLQALVSSRAKPTTADCTELFHSFDKNQDDKIDFTEFKNVWNNWIQKLLKPVTALLVIDVQNDFIDGTLAMKNCPAKQDGNQVIPPINNILLTQKFDVVVYSLDWHPEDHISFFDNVDKYELSKNCKVNPSKIKLFDTVKFAKPVEMEQVLWPRHCVQNTAGAELHRNLTVVENSVIIHKGTNSEIDSYSAFYDNLKLSETPLHTELQKRCVTHVFVCGIAFDYCVAFTALDALDLGYATVVIKDATMGTDFTNIDCMTSKLKDKNGVVECSTNLENLINARSINLEFAKVLGKNV